MSGPTMFGSTSEAGTVEAYYSGVSVYNRETITGLIDTRYVPLATPEAYIGGVLGLKAMIRYFPEVNLSEYGNTKYLGYGLQWSASGLFDGFSCRPDGRFLHPGSRCGRLYRVQRPRPCTSRAARAGRP